MRRRRCGGISLFDPTKASFRLRPGDKFAAIWSRTTITVEAFVGEGANGSVYLARSADGPSYCALKIGNDIMGLQSEINALRAVGGEAPALLLADDGEVRGVVFPFYLMPFVDGISLRRRLAQRPGARVPHTAFAGWGERILGQLCRLHSAGWVFGDMKPDNIMISPQGHVRFVDYGGATRFGQSVKQFTEFYDRGYWKAGGRKAEPAYDLFAFAVVMLEAADQGNGIHAAANGKRRDRSALLLLVEHMPHLGAYKKPLKGMIRSEYGTAEEALQAWRAAAAMPVAVPAPAEGERWPALWFAGAFLCFTSVVWWVLGP
jgi:serine/threonine protein kinase